MHGPGGWVSSQSDFINTATTNADIDCFWIDLDRHLVNETKSDTISSENPYEPFDYQRRGIHIFESIGRDLVGFCASESLLLTVCEQWQIPKSFVEEMLRPGSLPYFKYVLEKSTTTCTEPVAINLGFRWGTGHANYIVAFGRYYIPTSTLAMCIASKALLDYKKPNCDINDFTFSSVRDLTQRFEATLWEHPLNLVAILLECCERLVDVNSQHYNLESLAVSKGQKSLLTLESAEWLDSWGVQPRVLGRKIDELFSLYSDVIWGMKNCQELVKIGKAYMDLARDVDKAVQYSGNLQSTKERIMPTHLVEGAIFRTELHAELLRYSQNIINMQFTHQYSHTAQEDAEATKTISCLTLIFLPSTFVCAVFSTTIFNFQNWKKTNGQSGVVSSGWWIFVLTCLILSLGTVAAWIGLKMAQTIRYKRSTLIDSEIGVVDRKAAKSNR